MSRFIAVCRADEVAVDSAVRVEVEGQAIAVVRDSAGEVYAIGDTCTHGDISLAEGFVEGCTLECWAHGSRFSLTTGWPETLPAYEPVPVYDVKIADGEVLVDPTPHMKPKETA